MSRCLWAAFALLLAGCTARDAPPAGAPQPLPPTDVATLTLAPKPIAQSSEFVATIRSLRSTTVQPLVQIDPDREQAAATTEAQRAARQADLNYARQQLARLQTLFEARVISRAELEAAETAQATAEAQLAAVESQMREHQVQLQ